LDKNFGNNSQSNKPKDETIFEMIKNESNEKLDELIKKLQEEKAKRLSQNENKEKNKKNRKERKTHLYTSTFSHKPVFMKLHDVIHETPWDHMLT